MYVCVCIYVCMLNIQYVFVERYFPQCVKQCPTCKSFGTMVPIPTDGQCIVVTIKGTVKMQMSSVTFSGLNVKQAIMQANLEENNATCI